MLASTLPSISRLYKKSNNEERIEVGHGDTQLSVETDSLANDNKDTVR